MNICTSSHILYHEVQFLIWLRPPAGPIQAIQYEDEYDKRRNEKLLEFKTNILVCIRGKVNCISHPGNEASPASTLTEQALHFWHIALNVF